VRVVAGTRLTETRCGGGYGREVGAPRRQPSWYTRVGAGGSQRPAGRSWVREDGDRPELDGDAMTAGGCYRCGELRFVSCQCGGGAAGRLRG
jgi:hypothetical protein